MSDWSYLLNVGLKEEITMLVNWYREDIFNWYLSDEMVPSDNCKGECDTKSNLTYVNLGTEMFKLLRQSTLWKPQSSKESVFNPDPFSIMGRYCLADTNPETEKYNISLSTQDTVAPERIVLK